MAIHSRADWRLALATRMAVVQVACQVDDLRTCELYADKGQTRVRTSESANGNCHRPIPDNRADSANLRASRAGVDSCGPQDSVAILASCDRADRFAGRVC